MSWMFPKRRKFKGGLYTLQSKGAVGTRGVMPHLKAQASKYRKKGYNTRTISKTDKSRGYPRKYKALYIRRKR